MPACATRQQARSLAGRVCGTLSQWGYRGVIAEPPGSLGQPWGAGIAVVIALARREVLVIECRPARACRRRSLSDFQRYLGREGHPSFAVRDTWELEQQLCARGLIAP